MRNVALLFAVVGVVACGGDDSVSTGTGPDTIIDQAPPALGSSSHVSVTFHSDDATAVFGCQVDGSGGSACTSPYAFTVADGMHTIGIIAQDTAGNLGSAAMASFTVDTMAPDTVITNAPTGVVMSTTAMIAFAAQPADPAATFQCAFDTTTFTACTSPTSVTGSDGDHTFAVRATDAAGNTDPTPAMATWTISTTGPELAFTEKPTDPSNVKTPTFGFTSSDTSATFQCQVDGLTTFGPCGSPFTTPSLADGSQTFEVRATDTAQNQTTISYTWTVDTTAPAITFTGGPSGPTNVVTPTFTFTVTGAPTDIECETDTGGFSPCTSPVTTATLGQGAHTFTVQASDAAGNTGTATQSFSIDTVSPTVAITSGPSGPTNNPQPSWAFTTTGSPTTITCAIDSATPAACTSPFAVTTNLADGAHTFTVAVADLAGNTGTDSRTITVDTVAPVVTITSGPTGTITNVTPTFTFTVTGGAVSTSCRMDTGAFAPCSATFTSPALGGGAHTFEVDATDAAGNTGTATQSFTVDSSAPTVTITGAPPGITNDATPTFTFVAGATAATVQCQVDGGALAACTSPFTTAALAEGSHTVTVQACTAVPECASDSRTFTVDLTPPVVTITAGPQDPTPTASNAPTFTFTATDAISSVASETCRIKDAANPNPAFVACSGTFTSSSQLTDGSHTFEVKAVDAAGNTADVTRAFTVDSTPPAIVIEPPAIATRTRLTQPKVFFALFDASVVSATCAVDTGAAVACDGTAGFSAATPLAEGVHVYHITATDAAGNQATASVSFTVDTTPPTVTVNSGPANPTNDTGPTFTFTVGADAVAVSCKMDTGETVSPCTSPVKFPSALTPGARTFTVTASDNAVPANSASATFSFFLGFCGDGSAQGTEVCDGNDLRGNSCTTLGDGFTQGQLQCSGSCVFDTTKCSTCGDGIIGFGEVCDGSNVGSASCTSVGSGFTAGDGTPGCNGTCDGFTTATCGTCGNGVIDGDEQCDPGNGSDIAEALGSGSNGSANTCASLNHAPGVGSDVGCTASCTFDLTNCTGGFVAANTNFSGKVCVDGLRYGPPTNNAIVGVCTEDEGVWLGTVIDATPLPLIDPVWTNNDGANAGAQVTSLTGRGLALYDSNSNFSFFTTNTTGDNFFHNTSSGSFASGVNWAAGQFNTDEVVGTQTFTPLIFSAKTSSSSASYFGGWDPISGQAVVVHGQPADAPTCASNESANNCNFPVLVGPAADGTLVTGTVTSIVSGNANVGSGGSTPGATLDIHLAVFGATPPTPPAIDITAGAPATGGGIYWTCNNGASYIEDDGNNGDLQPGHQISATDRQLVSTLVADYQTYVNHTSDSLGTRTCPSSSFSVATYAGIMYAGLRSSSDLNHPSGSLYKTSDGGKNWVLSNTGLPTNVSVYSLVIDCNGSTGVPIAQCAADNRVFAATSAGLYTSIDYGAHWTLAGLEGQNVRAVALDVLRTNGAISPKSRSGATESVINGSNVATFVTNASLGFQPGDVVTVAGAISPAAYAGTYTVLSSPAPTATSFSVNMGSVAGLATGGSGSVYLVSMLPRVFAATDQENGMFQANIPRNAH